jgi:hypothetical protein
MVHKAVGGIIDIDDLADFLHPVSRQSIGGITLCQVILKYLKMSDGHSLVAKVHQAGTQLETNVIIPHTPEAKRMIATMNKNVATFLWHMLLKQGLPDDFTQPLLKKTCDPTLFAEIPSCTWDATQRTLTTKKDLELNEKLKAFKDAPWFKDEFGLLNKPNPRSGHIAPKALYKLDGGGSYRTIHDRHRPTAGTADKGTTKKVGFANANNISSNDDSSQDSASRSSLTSSKSISIIEQSLPKDPLGGNITSASSAEEEGTSCATDGG